MLGRMIRWTAVAACLLLARDASAQCSTLKSLDTPLATLKGCAEKSEAGAACQKMQIDSAIRRIEGVMVRVDKDAKCAPEAVAEAKKNFEDYKARISKGPTADEVNAKDRSDRADKRKDEAAAAAAAQAEEDAQKKAFAKGMMADMPLIDEFGSQIEAPMGSVFKAGAAEPAQGTDAFDKVKRAMNNWERGSTGCAPGARFEKVERLKQRCAEFLGQEAAYKKYLAASAPMVLDSAVKAVAGWVKQFREIKQLDAERWRYFLDVDWAVEQEKKVYSPLFAAAGLPFPDTFAKGLKDQNADFLKAVDEVAAASTMNEKPDAAFHAMAVKCYTGVQFETLVGGAWKPSPATVKAIYRVRDDWLVNRNALGAPTSRIWGFAPVIQVQGEKYARMYFAGGSVGVGQLAVEQEYVGGAFKAPGNATCVAGKFFPMKHK
jgi:hypothetical protein